MQIDSLRLGIVDHGFARLMLKMETDGKEGKGPRGRAGVTQSDGEAQVMDMVITATGAIIGFSNGELGNSCNAHPTVRCRRECVGV